MAGNYTLALLLREGGDFAGMKERLEVAAGGGHAEANFCLGDMLFHGSDSFQVVSSRCRLFC